MSDTLLFFRSWLTDPLRVASVIPSGNSLANLICSGVVPGAGPVLELGPGTGVFTRALVRRGVLPHELTLVEAGAEFATLLARRFPEACVVREDAARLRGVASAGHRVHASAISGLPLLSMPAEKVEQILDGAFSLLEPRASLFQFTYGWRCPVPKAVLGRLGLVGERFGSTFANFPPATVWRISARQGGIHAA